MRTRPVFEVMGQRGGSATNPQWGWGWAGAVLRYVLFIT